MPTAGMGRGTQKFGHGATLKSRALVKRLMANFEEEKWNSGPLFPVSQVTEITEVTFGKGMPHKSPKNNVDKFTETTIRNHVHICLLQLLCQHEKNYVLLEKLTF